MSPVPTDAGHGHPLQPPPTSNKTNQGESKKDQSGPATPAPLQEICTPLLQKCRVNPNISPRHPRARAWEPTGQPWLLPELSSALQATTSLSPFCSKSDFLHDTPSEASLQTLLFSLRKRGSKTQGSPGIVQEISSLC